MKPYACVDVFVLLVACFAVTSPVNIMRLIDYESIEDKAALREDELISQDITEFYEVFDKIKQVHLNLYETLNLRVVSCPSDPPNIQGPIDLDTVFKNETLASEIQFYEKIDNEDNHKVLGDDNLLKDDLSLLNTTTYGDDVQLGGYWQPSTCVGRSRVAIIIPYRNRFVHLAILIRYLHIFLQRQQLEYRLIVTEHVSHDSQMPFNKGRIMNAAYLEAIKLDPDIDCVIFHDVDLMPEDDRNMYSCSVYPRHLSVAIDKFNYKLPYKSLVGGVLNFRCEHFELLNGYSNQYWGWGGEDDDMEKRFRLMKLNYTRPLEQLARYRMVKHSSRWMNPMRRRLLARAFIRHKTDGLNSLYYRFNNTVFYTGFTYFLFDVGSDQDQKGSRY